LDRFCGVASSNSLRYQGYYSIFTLLQRVNWNRFYSYTFQAVKNRPYLF